MQELISEEYIKKLFYYLDEMIYIIKKLLIRFPNYVIIKELKSLINDSADDNKKIRC